MFIVGKILISPSGPDPWFVFFFHRRLGNCLVHLTFTDCLSYLSLPFGREMIFGLLSSTGRHQTSANTVPALYKCRISDVVEGRFVLHRLHWLWRLRTPTICRRSKLSRPQGAMQAFLVYREDSSHEARSTKKQIYVNSFWRISVFISLSTLP